MIKVVTHRHDRAEKNGFVEHVADGVGVLKMEFILPRYKPDGRAQTFGAKPPSVKSYLTNKQRARS